MKRLSFLVITFLTTSIHLFAQAEHTPLLKGNEAYQANNYLKAEEEYLRAIEANPNSVKGHYNRANAIYKGIQPEGDAEAIQERLDKAAASYLSAIDNTDNHLIKSKAYHNLGNTYVGKKEYDKGIEAYKNALRLNPRDMDTKTNLQYAMRQQQQEQQQQQQEQEQQEGEEQQEQEQEQEQQEENSNQEENKEENKSSEGENEQDEEQEQEQQEKKESSGEGGEKKEQPQPEDVSKEEVLRQLKVMDEEEKKVQGKLKKEQKGDYQSDKDW